MPQSGADPSDTWCSAFSEGGVGAAAYSVKARLLTLAAIGVSVPLDMMAIQRQTARTACTRGGERQQQLN